MKNNLCLLMLVLLWAVIADAQTAKKEITVYGEVVDITNYVRFGTKPDNPDRIAVAEASIKNGNPLGILERDTKRVYLVTGSQTSANDRLKQFFGQRIFAKGIVYRRGGIPLFIMSDIGKSVK